MRKLHRAGVAAATLSLILAVSAFSAATSQGTQIGPARPGSGTSGISFARSVSPGNPMVAAAGHPGPAVIAGRSISTVQSLNWAGYAVSRAGAAFRYVQAAFFVPYVDCSSTPNSYSSHWVGLDGLGSSTVEQIGVAAGCAGSIPQYYAWYEMYPKSVSVAFSVRPGNSITASVFYKPATGRFVLKLQDTTTGQQFSRSLRCAAKACIRSSAEVISEAPSNKSGNILPLADYRAASFSSISITNARGRRGGLDSKWWSSYQIVQVGQASHEVAAQPTSLDQGRAYTNYWFREN